MLLVLHRQDDFTELHEVFVLLRVQRIPLKEWNDHRLQTSSTRDCVCHNAAVGSLRCDVTTTKVVPQLLEQFEVVTMLIDLEYRSYQPLSAIPDRRMRMDAYAEATLSVDEPAYVLGRQCSLRPSLLIVRTGHVFTSHVATLLMRCDTSSSAGYSEFPAYSRVLQPPKS